VRDDLIFRLRPADSLNLSFLSVLLAITAIFHQRIEGAASLTVLYSSLIFFQAVLMRIKDKNALSRWVYDLIFPTVSILLIFDSLGRLVHSVNPTDIDHILMRLDYMLFLGNPTVMMEKIASPLLTDVLQLAYTSYYFLPISLGIVLKLKEDDIAFDRSIFFVMLCFYLSYIGYLLMPALGPRFTLNHLHDSELKGFLIAQPIQEFLNRLEGIKRDAFPSGHTAVALTVLYLTSRYEKRLFRLFLPVVLALIFSTVYLRYHYVVDVFAGVLLALITIVIGEKYYGCREKRVGLTS
jgi:membrane-associated phospholipid phosphatase